MKYLEEAVREGRKFCWVGSPPVHLLRRKV